jgi:hypothetical protein
MAYGVILKHLEVDKTNKKFVEGRPPLSGMADGPFSGKDGRATLF